MRFLLLDLKCTIPKFIFFPQSGTYPQEYVGYFPLVDKLHAKAEEVLRPMGVPIFDAHLAADRLYHKYCTMFNLYKQKHHPEAFCNDWFHPLEPVMPLMAKMLTNHFCN